MENPVHATVAEPGTVLLLDDGSRLPLPAAAVTAGGLLRLRSGQRVQAALGQDGSVTAVTLTTLPLPDPR